MRIGIMTLWQTEYNYGAVLQCFALQEYLRKCGYRPYLIRYRDGHAGKNYHNISIRKICSYVKRKIGELRYLTVKDEPRYFSEFIKEYMEVSEKVYQGYHALKSDPPKADVYIAGSDQIWNFYKSPLESCRDNIHAYFLDFGKEKVCRMSYAASWDEKYVTEEHLAEIKPLLKRFDYVSVREEKGISLCEKCGVSAEWTTDPTLLLRADDYRKIYQDKSSRIRKIDQKYIFVYMVMTQKRRFDLSQIYAYAKEKELRVIYVAEDRSKDNYEKYYPTIPEWLYLLDHAEYVVTNSFHGTVFSILFEKQFGTIPLEGYSAATNERIYSLCNMFHIQPRFIKDGNMSVLDLPYKAQFCAPKNHFDQQIAKVKRMLEIL